MREYRGKIVRVPINSNDDVVVEQETSSRAKAMDGCLVVVVRDPDTGEVISAECESSGCLEGCNLHQSSTREFKSYWCECGLSP
jgi:hypothetical protein